MPKFRLDEEAWIPVVMRDGAERELSLTEVFENAADTEMLSGTPLEVAALTRFLLAIAHLTETPASLARWGELWQDREDFMRRCAAYVREQGEVWDIFDDTHPFGQVAGLQGTENPAYLLIYESARKNNALLADHSVEEFPRTVEPSLLARGLITTNAFAGSSGGGYRSGPLAMRTTVILTGTTLDRNLLLNLLVSKNPMPAFDWKAYGAAESAHGTAPDFARRYLWHSRRILLSPASDSSGVRSATLAPGNAMEEVDRESDPMVAMHLDSKGEKYIPLRLRLGRNLWRSAHVLLNCREDGHPTAALEQLARLIDRELLQESEPVSIRACAVAGEAQGPKSELWRDESLPFGTSVILRSDRIQSLERAVQTAEDTAKRLESRLYGFAHRYIQDGSEATPDKNEVVRLRDELAQDLTDFWAELAPDGERIALDNFDEGHWAQTLYRVGEKAFRVAVERLPPDARRFRAEYVRTAKKETTRKTRKKGTVA